MRTRQLLVLGALLSVTPTCAQGPINVNQPEEKHPSDSKTRVFISDSKSWEISGGLGAGDGAGAGAIAGGARPQTAEIIKTFAERCPSVTVTMKQEKADYVVLLDHEGGKEWFQHRNKVAVFNRDGDAIFSRSTLILGNSVKDACAAIQRDSGKRQQVRSATASR